MKIGQFAKAHQVSIDTIRHYMDLKLLVPVKEGAHYHFDERSQEEMKWIVRLKNLGFTLSEIKSLLSFMRIGKMTDYQQSDLYRKIFMDRLEKVKAEIETFEIHRDRLSREIEALHESEVADRQNFGIPLDALSLFACSDCRGELKLKSAEIVDGEIINGNLVCDCGRSYPVKEGILYSVGTIHREESNHYVEQISDYILATPQEYIDRLYTSIGWGYSIFEELDQKDKIALELGSGLGVFLRNIYDKLDDSLTYIVVDHDIQVHLFLKDILSKASVKKRVIFITADFADIPLKKDTVDILVDVAGSSNYAFDNNAFLIKKIDPIVAREATLLSGLLMFDNFTQDSQISKDHRWLFSRETTVNAIEALGYRLMAVKETDRASEGGIYENFFMPGEKIYSLLIKAKRWG